VAKSEGREARSEGRKARSERRGARSGERNPKSDQPGARSEERGARAAILAALALVALTLCVFLPVRHFDFVNWDDPGYLTENPVVQGGLSWSNAAWAFTTTHEPYWHPVTWLSHMLDVSLFGMDPGWHHVTNLVIHLGSTLILFAVLRRMTRETWKSAFVAAIFAVHPLHVESVAWLAERKDVLSTLFLAATIWLYVRYVERPGIARYLAVVIAYAFALMAKPMVVTLPLALLLLDVWPLGRVSRSQGWLKAIVDKVPLLIMAIGTSVTTVIVQKNVGAVAGLNALPLRSRLANALAGYITYLWRTIWPAHLAAFYPLHAYPWWVTVLCALLLGVLTAVAFLLRARQPYLLVGWLWFVIAVAPVIGLVQAGEQATADRFMYVPMVGLTLIAAWGGSGLLRRIGVGARGIAIVSLTLIAASALTARVQAGYWVDSLTLWQHAAQVTDGNYVAYEKMGEAFRDRGQFDQAAANYEQSLRLAPPGSPVYDATIQNSLGLVRIRQGRADEAAAHFAEAVRLNPGFAEAQSNFGNALAAQGRYDEAIEHYRAALAIKPDFQEALIGTGGSLVRAGRPAEAVAPYREALRIDPQSPQAHNGLGSALSLLHRDDEAMAEFNRALELKPDLPSAHLNIAIVLLRRGDVEGARRRLETALSIDPSYEPARNVLARIR
jgi:tetratricopeptide (TPR) repeat protein